VPYTAPMSDDALHRVRTICLALPETRESVSHGAPTWWVAKRTFANYTDDHHGDGRLALWLAAPPGLQETLVEEDPEVFFRPPYVGVRGWVGVRLDRELPWEQVEDLINEAWKAVAPPRLAEGR
jgi:hypothetical protein